MKSKIEMSLGYFLGLLLITLVLGFIISYSALLVMDIKAAHADFISAIVGSLGNVIGGIIGVIAAVLIATYQIRKTIELDRTKGAANNSAILRLLNTELKANRKLIETFKSPYQSGSSDFLAHISTDNWERASLSIGLEISDKTLELVSSSYRKIKLLKTPGQKMDEETYGRLIGDIDNAVRSIESDLAKLTG